MRKKLRDILGDRIVSETPTKKRITFTIKCFTENCPNTCKIEKHKRLPGYCTSCQHESMRITPFKSQYTKILKRCDEQNKLGRHSSFTYDELLYFVNDDNNKKCYYCQRDTIRKPHGDAKKSLLIDRKDSSKGYTLDNCVSCCWECNNMKSDWFTAEQFKLVRMIYDNKLKELKQQLENVCQM